MASEENHNVFPVDDLDDDEDDIEEEEKHQLDDEEEDALGEEKDDALEEEEDEDLNSVSSVDPITVTVAVTPPPITASVLDPNQKRQRVEASPIASTVVHVEKKQLQQPLDEARKMFQRLWTDEDEIELLQGFVEYTTQRGSSQHHHHDTALFYDQIKSKLQLDFNKNQLVEKLRRLKKKYRNVVSRISSGKEFVFKTHHDQATFEISRKIWGDAGRAVAAEDGGIDDDEPNANSHPNINSNFNNSSVNNHGINDGGIDSAEKKAQSSRKRPRVKAEEKMVLDDKGIASVSKPASSIHGLVEETVRNCLSPLFKELLNNAMNGPCAGGTRGLGGGMLSPIPLNFGGSSSVGNLFGCEMVDEKWRKQQILELEVYSKRLELVQDQIKATLEDLRSVGSG